MLDFNCRADQGSADWAMIFFPLWHSFALVTECPYICFLDCRLLPPALAEGHVADMPTSASMAAHHTDPWWA